MTTDFHTDILAVAPANAAIFNAPLGQLDQAIGYFQNGFNPFNLLNYGTPQAVTISADTIIQTKTYVVVDTEGGAAADDLSTIATLAEGNFLILKIANNARVVTVKHNVGNIYLSGGLDIVLNNTNLTLMLFYNGSKWTDSKPSVSLSLPVNTKGDLLTWDTALARLPVGSDGQILTADSAQSLGVKWATPLTYAETILVANAALGSDAANIDLTSISGSYKHLILKLQLRSDRAATNDNVYVRLNNDSTAANYYSYSVNDSGTTPTLSVLERLAVTATAVEVRAGAVGNTGPADWMSYLEVHILNYTDTNHPRVVSLWGFLPFNNVTGGFATIQGGGLWTNTANAVNRITILPVTGTNWKAKTTYELIGVS